MPHCIDYHDGHHGMMVTYDIVVLVRVCGCHDEVDDKSYDGNHDDQRSGSLHDDQMSGSLHDDRRSGSHRDDLKSDRHYDGQKSDSIYQSPQINH